MTGATADLPDAVRQRLLVWAAAAVGDLPVAEVPAPLRGVARFAPGKRARLGAAALARQLDSDAEFRAMVAQRVDGEEDRAGDPVGAAARAALLRLPDAEQLIGAVAAGAQESALRTRIAELEATVARLTERMARIDADAVPALQQEQAAARAAREDLDRLRKRLRDQGARLRALQEQVERQARTADDERVVLRAELAGAREAAASWQRRAEEAAARADAAARTVVDLRQSAGDQRARTDRRLELLLSTLEQAAVGLRREWQLVGGGPDPADEVAARLARPPADAERTSDPARLLTWMSLPGAHLLVDGYNVTKSGYPELSLAEQRDRLVRGLSALASRLSADVTVVFDGAAVSTARPPGRGVRVLFSAPGVSADDVLRDLVAAEPVGRVLVLVSSDRAVVDSAARHGARTAPSATLLSALTG